MNLPTDRDIDIGRLLTIDVESELRKLSQAQLQGPWQIPTEFVRRALRNGATEIDVQLSRHRARVIDDGSGVDPSLLQWTAVLLDHRRPNAERHNALTVLEGSGELALLAVAGLSPRAVTIDAHHGGRRHVLEYTADRAPRLRTAAASGSGCTVTIEAHGLERRACADWLIDAAKFASAAIRVDGKLIPHGFSHAFAIAELAAPLRGRLAIPFEGETAHAWLLEHGIVTGHVAIPEAPCFEAAIELGSGEVDLSAARVREAVQPHVAMLVDQAVTVLARVAGQAGGMPEPARARLARLVLQAARKQLRTQDIVRAQVFRVADAEGERWTDILGLQAASQRDASGALILLALYPGQRPDRYALGAAPVLVADEAERSLLSELLQARFRPPDARDARESLRGAWHRGVDGLGRALGRAADLLRHPLRGKPIDDDLLPLEEHQLLEELRLHLSRDPHRSVEGITMCAGAGPIRRTRGGTPMLLLPRRNPAVAACVRAIAQDRR
ncbi:MAG TPA: hypothetical protein VFG69_18345, partial [Nannocystaceae bacterium]|nr:hypothetical protein [Nannocystaceae bacterium]